MVYHLQDQVIKRLWLNRWVVRNSKLSFSHKKIQRERKKSQVAKSCLTLCNPMDCSLPGSSVHGLFQARVLERVAISFSRGSSRARDCTWVSCIAGRRFTIWATREAPLREKERDKKMSGPTLLLLWKTNVYSNQANTQSRKATFKMIGKFGTFLFTHSPSSGFPDGSDQRKSPPAMQETQVRPWIRKIPWRRAWQPTPVFLPGKSHGLRNLVGYSPWGHKESDTTD